LITHGNISSVLVSFPQPAVSFSHVFANKLGVHGNIFGVHANILGAFRNPGAQRQSAIDGR